jgi:SAM-dependent methyltransferase
MNENKFNGKAEVYDNARPSYPREAIEYIEQFFPPRSVCVDVGSGTGKLTGCFLADGYTVYAVEPNSEMREIAEINFNSKMREIAERNFNSDKRDFLNCRVDGTTEKEFNSDKRGLFDYYSVDGTAENTTLKDGIADFVTVAQALHWFDIEKFRAECKRILKPNGKVFVVYNRFVGALADDYGRFLSAHCAAFKGFGGGDSEEKIKEFFGESYNCKPPVIAASAVNGKEFFGEGCICKAFFSKTEYNLDLFTKFALSTSYTPRPDDADYSEFIEDLKEFFEKYQKDGKIVFDNATSVYHI